MKLFKHVLLIFVLVLPAWAQEEDTFKLNVNVDLVELHVSVIDDYDRPVSGLLKEHFRIVEDRIEQPISVFKQEDQPVSLGLVIDNSRSIEPRKQRLDAAALSFVRKSNPQDETFLIHFDDTARLARDFTDSIKELETTLAEVQPYGQTAIYDAVVLALDQMEKSKYTKKAILLITDGVDNVSKHSLEEAIERTKRTRVAIYTIGLLSQSGGIKAEDSLIKMAEASGGAAYFPQDADEAARIVERVARDLREQYTLGYFPTNPSRNGAWRSVRVEIAPPIGFPKIRTSYRLGYYGPDN
jgi:VWFA-related protein